MTTAACTSRREATRPARSELRTKVDAARKAIGEMSGSAVAWEGHQSWQGVVYPDVNTVIGDLEASLCKAFQVLDLTRDAARGALFREADRLAPASTG